jgi:hypothetical protein
MTKTFISYARADQETALRIARELRAAGIDLWIDQLDIPTGSRWDREIEKALKAWPNFVVLLSPAAVESDNVLDEVAYALDHKKTILPVIITKCDVPLRLRRLQHIDLAAGEAAGIARLKVAIERLLPTSTSPPMHSNVQLSPVHAPKHSSSSDASLSDSDFRDLPVFFSRTRPTRTSVTDTKFGEPNCVHKIGDWLFLWDGQLWLNFWHKTKVKQARVAAGSHGSWKLRINSSNWDIAASGARTAQDTWTFQVDQQHSSIALIGAVEREFVSRALGNDYPTLVSASPASIIVKFGDTKNEMQGETLMIDASNTEIKFTTCKIYGNKTFSF